MIRRIVPLLLALAAFVSRAPAQCAQWDQGFHIGFDNDVTVFTVFDDGTGPALYTGGYFTLAGGVSALHIAKWDGTSWSALGAPGSGMNDTVFALTVFDDGSGPALYAGGLFTTVNGTPANHVAKWNGTSWSTLGAATNGGIASLRVFDDGSGPALYAGGSFTTAGGVSAANIAKWNGTSWSALNSPGNDLDSEVDGMCVFDDGTGPALFVCGQFFMAGGLTVAHVVKWDGTSWSALGNGFISPVLVLAVYDDGTGPALYAGGYFMVSDGDPATAIAKWNGTSWTQLDGGIQNDIFQYVDALSVFDDGSGPALFIGGIFTAAGGMTTSNIVRWNGTTFSPVGAPIEGVSFADSVGDLAVFDDGSGPGLYVGGHITSAGGSPATSIAKWNGTAWSTVGQTGNGIESGSLSALASFDDGTGPALFAGGSFLNVAAGVSIKNIGKWNGTQWSALGTGISNNVETMTGFDDGSGSALYAGGQFDQAGGISARNLARWNGTSWSSVGDVGSSSSRVHSLRVFNDGTGTALYVAGEFASAGGVAASNIARWNGSTWSPLGSGLANFPRALESFNDGTGPALYAGGSFTTAGGAAASRVAKWNGSSWSAIGSGVNGTVNALVAFNDGSGAALFAGGSFTTAGGAPAARIAKWNGASWSALGSGVNGTVNALVVFDDGAGAALYACGSFTTAGGGAAARIAKWNGTTWSALGSGLSSTVSALAVFDDGSDGDADLYAGGFLTSAGGHPSSRIAEWHGCGTTSFCFGDGMSGACPCGNSGAQGHGCNNSQSTGGAALTASGTKAPDTFKLTQTGELPSSLSIFLQGNVDIGSPLFFGDGLRCIGGTLVRLYVHNASSGNVSAPQAGDPSITTRSAALGDPIGPGSTRFYQVYYRDPNLAFCPGPFGDAFNVGNALRVVW